MTGSFPGWRGYLRHLTLVLGALAAAVGITLTSGPAPTASPAAAATAPVAAARAQGAGAVALARKMAADQGWTGQQWGCLDQLWTRENATWDPTVENASGAHGIPQALPGSKMASAGADWATNPATQIKWGLGYIRSRYGSPCGAWSVYCVNTPSHPVDASTGACWY